jgi:predicted transcriptional regulator
MKELSSPKGDTEMATKDFYELETNTEDLYEQINYEIEKNKDEVEKVINTPVVEDDTPQGFEVINYSG